MLAFMGASLVMSLMALALLDVEAPSTRFWRLYGGSLALAVLAPAAGMWAPFGLGAHWAHKRAATRGAATRAAPTVILVSGVVALGATLRLYHLPDLPFGLWYDEAANGLEALRVLNEPQYKPVYTDGVNATGHYLFLIAAAFEWFGISAQSIRLVSALMGIATVGAAYLAAKELFGGPLAVVAALLMAVSRWAINFSRLGMYNISTPLFELLTIAFLLRALRRNSLADFALAGLSLGLGLCFYPAFQLFVAVVGLFLAGALWTRRVSLRRVVLGLAVMAACVFVVLAPVLRFALEKPDAYFSRVQGTSLISDKAQDERAPRGLPPLGAAFGANLRKHLLMFNVRGDPNGRHNLPGEPMLDPMTAALFVAGVALSLVRWRQPAHLLLIVWLLASLMGGVLSLDFEAPQSLRSIGALPAALLLAVTPLHALHQEWAGGGGRYYPRAFMVFVAMLLVPIMFSNVDTYFRRQAQDFASWNAHSTPETLTAHILNSLGPDTHAYVISLFDQHPTVRFLTRNRVSYRRLDTTATLPLVQPADADLALILDAERRVLYEEAIALYPDAQREEFQAPFGSPTTLYYVHVPAEQLAAIQGLEARYFAGEDAAGRPAIVRKDMGIDFNWPDDAPLDLPFSVEWRGVLVAETYGPYQLGLSAPARAELYVDEYLALSLNDDGARNASASLALAHGNHSLRVTASGAEGPVRLVWRTPERERETLPAQAVYVSPVTNNGLLGRYFANGDWSGSAALAQIDTRFQMYFHILPLNRPYTVEWTGKIAIPEPGPYGFGLTSTDESVLYIDETEVVSSGGKGDYGQATADLAEGLHDIRIRYADRTDHTGISVYWTPPTGAGRQIIPAAVLFPPQGDYSQVTLPAFDDLWADTAPTGTELDAPQAEAVDVTVIASGLTRPAGLAVLPDGRVAVAVPDERAVLVIDMTDGTRHELSRRGAFVEPFDVATDGRGNLYVLDSGAGRVSLFDSGLNFVRDLAIDSSYAGRARGMDVDGESTVWLADTSGGRVAAFGDDGSMVRSLAAPNDGSGLDAQPVDVLSMADGSVWTTDAGVHKLTLYSPEGLRLRSWDIPVANTRDGSHLASGKNGEIYMTEPERRIVARLDASGRRIANYAVGEVEGIPVKPVGIAVDDEGNVWLTDVEGGRILRLEIGAGARDAD